MEAWQLKQLQALPLEIKVAKTKQRIREWVDFFGIDGVYVSFSGGKDSTALLHIARELYPDIPAVFSDTGLEFPEIREFVKTVENVTWIKPKLNFKQVIEKCGYPVISKETAEWVYRLRNESCTFEIADKLLNGKMRDGRTTNFKLAEQWRFLLNAPFKIGSGCCKEMKKQPFHIYERQTGRTAAIIGTMAEESKLREQQWLKQGCNAFNAKRTTSTPLSFWREADIWQYLKENNVPYCKIYDLGYYRTGCVFCAFGVQYDDEPNRFQRLQKTHPTLWRYCMKPTEQGGLGMREVLDFIGIPYERFMLTEEQNAD